MLVQAPSTQDISWNSPKHCQSPIPASTLCFCALKWGGVERHSNKGGELNSKIPIFKIKIQLWGFDFCRSSKFQPWRSLGCLEAKQQSVSKPVGSQGTTVVEIPRPCSFVSLSCLLCSDLVWLQPPQRDGGSSWLVGRLECLLLFVFSAPPQHSFCICICVHAAQLLLTCFVSLPERSQF